MHAVCVLAINAVSTRSFHVSCRFDVVSEQTRASVINTKSFGGQCRTIYSGVHQTIYRLPVSTLQYSFMVGHSAPQMIKP